MGHGEPQCLLGIDLLRIGRGNVFVEETANRGGKENGFAISWILRAACQAEVPDIGKIPSIAASIAYSSGEAGSGRVVSPRMASSRISRWIDAVRDDPLIWALPLQAVIQFHRLGFLAAWRDEWFTLQVVPQPLSQIRTTAAEVGHPPLYFVLSHYWIRIPWPPGELVRLRAMSVLWGLAATAILYRLWLKREPRAVQLWVIALWVLSPCLLLYTRMARSYSIQVAAALPVLAAATEWMRRPRSLGRLLAYAALSALLLYIHYLPGLAIGGAVAVAFAFRRDLSLQSRAMLMGSAALVAAILYLPGLGAIAGAIEEWLSSSSAPAGNYFLDQAVRLGWWFVSFSFGETLSTPALIVGAALAPAILFCLYRGVVRRPEWLGVVALSALFGYAGVIRWTSFPFTPARMLFLLPFFLMIVVKGARTTKHGTVMLCALALLYAAGDYDYFSRTGYLNKEYCVPYNQMAAVINKESPTGGTLLMVDEYSTFAEPLMEKIRPDIRVVPLDEEHRASATEDAEQAGPRTIWLLRHSHDTSPDAWVTGLEDRLAKGRTVTQRGYLPYSAPERWILTWLRGPGQPRYFYILLRYQ